MAFVTVEHWGNSINKSNGMNVILPEADGPFPVLYLLHGLGDDQTNWARWTSIERYASTLKLIIVMPNGERSFYCNDPSPTGLAWEDYISKDVVQFVDNTFPTIATAAGRAIAGLSMGGYGAILHHLRHPDVFSAACSHSGAMGFTYPRLKIAEYIDKISAVFPRRKYDLFALSRKADKRGVKIRMDCGVDDFLIEHNRTFHRHLLKLGVEHVYQENSGTHDWAYWDKHIVETLDFVMKHFAGPKKK
jgi:putative tributyrin esterase